MSKGWLETSHSEPGQTSGDPGHEQRLSQLGAQIARVVHELNDPVNLIAGSLSDLDQPLRTLTSYVQARPAPAQEGLEGTAGGHLEHVLATADTLLAICNEGVQRLRYLTRQLSAYARRTTPFAVREQVELAPLLERAERLARGGQTSALRVEWALAELPPVLGDAQALLQALTNIIRNAFDAAATAPAPCVRIGGTVAADTVQIRIHDNGPGVPPARRATVFTPFFTTKTAGLGLGLAIARESVEQCGGTLELSDDRGAGAEFVVTLRGAR